MDANGLIGERSPRIRVFGVGGAGGNAVGLLAGRGLANVKIIAANTDAQALRRAEADYKLQLGRATTGGLGAGSRPDIGKAAAQESLAQIEAFLDEADVCFIAAGMGGGTGSGASAIIASAASARGIPVIAAVTRPFQFEGARRAAVANSAIEQLERLSDAMIVVPNQNLLRMGGPATTFRSALREADRVLVQGVCGLSELVSPGAMKGVGLAELHAALIGIGRAVIGIGESSATCDRAAKAAEAAIANPLLDDRLVYARKLIVAISGGEDMGLSEVDEIVGLVSQHLDPDAELVWGATVTPEMRGTIRVTLVAKGEQPRAIVLAAPSAAPIAAMPEPVEDYPIKDYPIEDYPIEAPRPPIDLEDVVVQRPSINARDSLARNGKWLDAVSPIGMPGERGGEMPELILTQYELIARRYPSLVGQASDRTRVALHKLFGGFTNHRPKASPESRTEKRSLLHR